MEQIPRDVSSLINNHNRLIVPKNNSKTNMVLYTPSVSSRVMIARHRWRYGTQLQVVAWRDELVIRDPIQKWDAWQEPAARTQACQ
jgi:hypothetical protein